MNQHIIRSVVTFGLSLAALAVPLASLSSAAAQERHRGNAPSTPSTSSTPAASAAPSPHARARPIELLCLETLEVGASLSVVRAVVAPRDAEIVPDHDTNCYVIVGGGDLTQARETFRQLEERARARRGAHRTGRATGRAAPPS